MDCRRVALCSASGPLVGVRDGITRAQRVWQAWHRSGGHVTAKPSIRSGASTAPPRPVRDVSSLTRCKITHYTTRSTRFPQRAALVARPLPPPWDRVDPPRTVYELPATPFWTEMWKECGKVKPSPHF